MTKTMRAKVEKLIRADIRSLDKSMTREANRGEHGRKWLIDDYLRERKEKMDQLANL